MSVADMQSHHEHERWPKRRRLDSDSPDPLSRDHVEKFTRREAVHAPRQTGESRISAQQDREDVESGTDHQYAFEDEDGVGAEDSNTQSPAEEETEVDTPGGPPAQPTELDYKIHMTLKGHKRGVAAVKFSPNGKWIASCSADATIKIWDAQTGSLAHNLEGHLGGVSTLAWNPDSSVLATGSDDKTIRLWDVETVGSLAGRSNGHSG